jgi:hypothetical protein
MTNKKDIYLTADWHITIDPPQGRVETEEEWFVVQRGAIRQVAEIVKEDLLIIIGDIIDNFNPKGSHAILNMLAEELPTNTVWILGNHEFLRSGGDLQLIMEKGTAGTMVHMQSLKYLPDDTTFEWGEYNINPFNFKHGKSIEHREVNPDKINICLGHFLSFDKQLPHWAKDNQAWLSQDIVKEFPEYDLIAVGDNHETFNIGNKYLSPGSLTRRTIRQDKHKPCIHKYDGKELTPIYLDIKPAGECITKEHKIKADERSARLEEWGEGLNEKQEHTGDFKDDLNSHFLINKTKKPIQNLLNKIIMEIENER